MPAGTRGLFLTTNLQWGDWPPKHAPGFLSLELLETLPDAYRPVLPD